MFLQELFSKRVKKLRVVAGLKQSDVANAAGITNKSISMIESGQRGASIEVVCSLADYFNVSLDYLVGRSDNPEINQ